MKKIYTYAQIERYQNDKNIKEILPNRLRFSLAYRQKIYDSVYPELTCAKIAQFLRHDGYEELIRGSDKPNTIAISFKLHGRPQNDNRVATSKMYHHDQADDAILLATGKFEKCTNGIRFTDNFLNEIYHFYPQQSIEDSISKAGIDPELVGYQRILSLKRKFDKCQPISRKEKFHAEMIKKYSNHPYVKRITPKQFVLKECFYNEAYALRDEHIDDILKLYCIDYNDLPIHTKTAMHYKLQNWKCTNHKQSDSSDVVIQIQMNRLRFLQQIFEENLQEIGSFFQSTTCIEKKNLCSMIHSIPKDTEGYYTTTRILNIAGISRSTYYGILKDKHYGESTIQKEKQDNKDITIIRKVMDYKGFVKGSRQIYMNMYEITGKQFGLKKIRRLMKKVNIETSIRKKNHSRKVSQEMLKRSVKPNRLKRMFKIHEPNEVRLTDVTYLDFGNHQRAYASVCKDPVTGKLLDFTVSESNDLSLVMTTLEHLQDDHHKAGALFHSDQGVLYLNVTFQNKLCELGYQQSMSKRGNCWDNAPQESFFGHFKDECHYQSCNTLEELDILCQKYKEYYNHERKQWNLNKMTPVQYEQYLLSQSIEERQQRIQKETIKYEQMKQKAMDEAKKRASTLGV